MKCKSCGQENLQHINFCINCGDPIVTFKEQEENITLEEVQKMYGKEYLKKRRTNINLLTFFVLIIIVSIFLPFFVIGDNEVTNYAYYSNGIMMGAFIGGVSFVSLIFLLLRKKLPVLLLQTVAIGLYIFDLVNFRHLFDGFNLSEYKYGFYLISGSLIISWLLSLIRMFSKKSS